MECLSEMDQLIEKYKSDREVAMNMYNELVKDAKAIINKIPVRVITYVFPQRIAVVNVSWSGVSKHYVYTNRFEIGKGYDLCCQCCNRSRFVEQDALSNLLTLLYNKILVDRLLCYIEIERSKLFCYSSIRDLFRMVVGDEEHR